MPPLALTDQQLNLVTRAAGMITEHDRDLFLRSIANRIGDLAHPSDHDIQDALDFVLNNRGVVGGVKAFAIRHNRTRKANAVFR
jgi:hypothetical protein